MELRGASWTDKALRGFTPKCLGHRGKQQKQKDEKVKKKKKDKGKHEKPAESTSAAR